MPLPNQPAFVLGAATRGVADSGLRCDEVTLLASEGDFEGNCLRGRLLLHFQLVESRETNVLLSYCPADHSGANLCHSIMALATLNTV